MHRWRFPASGLLLALLFVPATRGQAPSLSETRLRKDLEFLTSDACEGRGITTKGINLAAEYIAAEFRKAGLKPGSPDGTYFQTFKLVPSFRTEPKNAQLADLQVTGPLGQTILLKYGTDFSLNGRSPAGTLDAPLVFAGYGIVSQEPKYDDFAALDVKGKAVVLLNRGPSLFADAGFHTNPSTSVHNLALKVANARQRGAVAVLVVNDRAAALVRDVVPPPFSSPFLDDLVGIPVLHLTRDLAERMLFASTLSSLANLEKDIDFTSRPRSTPLPGWTCQGKVNRQPNTVEVKNVIGVLDGAATLAKETVVMGAHYDHMGLDGNRRILGGTSPPGGMGGVGFPMIEGSRSGVYRGADDNASGTSAVIELARRFGAQPNRSGRRLVFMAFTAEESGLLGSRHYCKNPIFPLKDTVAMVNLDMVGRLQDSRLLAMGAGTGKGLEALVDRLARKHEFRVTKSLPGTGPTDHMSFCQVKVTGLTFFSGFHEYYHLVSDRVETLNIPGLRRIVDLTADVVGEVSTNPTRMEYLDNMTPFDRSMTLWSSAPCLGAELDFAHKGPGVRIRSLVSGAPATKAGLKPGDRIDSVDGKAVTGVGSYLDVVRGLRAGKKIELKGARDEKPLTLDVQLAAVPFAYALGITPEPRSEAPGVVVGYLEKDGLGAKAGLLAGDRLTELNGKQVKSSSDLFGLTAGVRKGAKVEVTFIRMEETKKATIIAE